MIRRKLSLILAAAMILSLLSAVYLPASARPLNGKTTEADTPASFEDGNTVSQEPTGEPYEPLPPQKSEELFFTKTRDNGDGTKTLELYGYPVSYRTKDGEIKDISLELKREGKGFRSGEHFVNTEFPEKIGEGITLKTDNLNIKITPVEKNIPGESGSEGKEKQGKNEALVSASVETEDGKRAVYRTDGKTSYEYELTYTGYKENIVVSEYTGQTDYFFTVYTNGLKLERENKEGSRGTGLVFVDESGIVAKTDDIIVCSADNRNNVFGEISVETVCENEEYVICIHVPEEYLSDPETHYPIYIDPTISVAYNSADSSSWNDIEDITLNQNAATDSPTSGTLYVGRAVAAYGAMRSVMRFPELELFGIMPEFIIEAKVSLRDLMCYGFRLQVDCYGYEGSLSANPFSPTNISWNNIYSVMQNYETDNKYHSSHFVSYNDGYSSGFWYDFDILPIVRQWAWLRNMETLQKTDQAIVFKSTDSYEQTSSEQFVCFGSYDRATYKPCLTIVYKEDDEFDSFYSESFGYYNNTFLGTDVGYSNYLGSRYLNLYADDGLQLRSNCYGYAIREFYCLEDFPDEFTYQLQSGSEYAYYLQQPGEFADKTNGLVIYNRNGTVWDTITDRFDLDNALNNILSTLCSSQDRMHYLTQLIQADAAALGYTVTPYIGNTIPDADTLVGERMIAMVASPIDYHFYVQHSDNSWSQKCGYGPTSNECLDGHVKLDNNNMTDHALEGMYSGGCLAFFLISKNAVVDNSHLNGAYTVVTSPYGINCRQTKSAFSDHVGNTFFSAKNIGSISGESLMGNIDYIDDSDWYCFTPVDNTAVSFTLTQVSNELYITIYDEGRNLLCSATSDCSGVLFSYNLIAGKKYTIRIKALGQTTHIYSNRYTVLLENNGGLS